MAGTIMGGLKAAATNKFRYGLGFYKQIGYLGGKKRAQNGKPVPWQLNSAAARAAGVKGGRTSRRVGPHRKIQRQCSMCPNVFMGVPPAAYCPPCLAEHIRARAKDWQRRHRT